MVTIGVNQSLSNSIIYEHVCLENINNLYKSYGKCDDQQHYKAILESEMVSTSEGGTVNITIPSIQYVTVKKTSARKPLR